MKILVFIIFTLTAALVFSEENKISRSEHVKAFNEAQRCFNVTSAREASKKAQCARDALEEGRFLFEPNSLNIASLTYNYGKALKPGDRDKAHDVLGESLELYQALYGKSSFETIDTLIEMGDAKDALKIARKYFDRNSLNYAGILLGLSMSDMIPSKDIMRYAGPAYEIFKKEGDPDSINTSLAGFQIARVKMAQEKYRSAIPYLISATKNPSVAAYAHGWLIEAYDSIGKYDSGSFHAQELGRLTPGRENADLLPVFVKAPKYPSYANRIRKSGFVLLELTVTTSGNASDLKVIEESPEGFDFAKSALKAAATLRYAPRFVNNEAQEVSGVRYKYIFQMER